MYVLSEGLPVIFAVTNQLSIANWTVLPGVQLAVLVVHQEERGAVSIDQLLGLVHDLQDQSVHADHFLENRPTNSHINFPNHLGQLDLLHYHKAKLEK